jgi:DNA-binding IscR family transcriptional regulator
MAAWGGTHAVVVRRTFAGLREAGIVTSEKGHGGGWRLARPPEEITLAEVRRVIERNPSTAPPPNRPDCFIERVVEDALAEANAEIERLLDRHFKALTLAKLDEAVTQLHAASPDFKGMLS